MIYSILQKDSSSILYWKLKFDQDVENDFNDFSIFEKFFVCPKFDQFLKSGKILNTQGKVSKNLQRDGSK